MRGNKSFANDLAKQRIEHLFAMALDKACANPELSDRYVSMAMRISSRTKVRISPQLKRQVCPSCWSFLLPGKSARYRLNERRRPHLTVTCLRCGHIERYPVKH